MAWLRANTRARRVGHVERDRACRRQAASARDASDLSRAFVSSLTQLRAARANGRTPPGADDAPVGVGLVVLGAGELTGQVSPTPAAEPIYRGQRGARHRRRARARPRAPVAGGAARRRRPRSSASPRSATCGPGHRSSGRRPLRDAQPARGALGESSGTLTVVLTGDVDARTDRRRRRAARPVARSARATARCSSTRDGERRALSRRLGARRASRVAGRRHARDRRPPARRHQRGPRRARLTRRCICCRPEPRPAPPIDRQRLRRLLERLQLQFNLVVIGGPPLGTERTSAVLVPAADCWLLVADAA